VVANAVNALEKAPPPPTFGAVSIDRRVLRTPARTIAIRNIATMTVGTDVTPVSPWPKIMAVLSALAFTFLILTNAQRFGLGPALIGAGLIFAVAVIVAIMQKEDRTHYLVITTSDGLRTRFTGASRDTVDEVWRILTDKIDKDDIGSTFNVNFENGTIENLNVGEVGTLAADTIVQGSNNQVVSASPGARLATRETHNVATNSPGAQIGTGNVQSASTNALTHVDYSGELSQVEDMQRFYARQPNAHHVAERLSELELLMRSGTPSTEGRSRVRDLAVDLSTIMQAYPALVQFFQGIAKLAGF